MSSLKFIDFILFLNQKRKFRRFTKSELEGVLQNAINPFFQILILEKIN